VGEDDQYFVNSNCIFIHGKWADVQWMCGWSGVRGHFFHNILGLGGCVNIFQHPEEGRGVCIIPHLPRINGHILAKWFASGGVCVCVCVW